MSVVLAFCCALGYALLRLALAVLAAVQPGGGGPGGEPWPVDGAPALARLERGLERMAARTGQAGAHVVMVSMGIICMSLSTLHGMAMLVTSGQLSLSPSDAWRAAVVIAHLTVELFVDLPQPDVTLSLAVGMWACGFMGALILATAALGLAASRRPSVGRAVGYSLLAAILLSWLVDLGTTLAEVSTWGRFGAPAARASLSARPGAGGGSDRRQAVFEDAHRLFTGAYHEQRCSVARRAKGGAPSSISCRPGPEETLARLLELSVRADFCQPRGPKRARQVEACLDHAQTLGALAGEPSDSDTIYCQCWCGYADRMQHVVLGYAVVWSALLHGVLRVLEAAAGPWLSKMGDVQRREFQCFAFCGMCLLMYRAAAAAAAAAAASGAAAA